MQFELLMQSLAPCLLYERGRMDAHDFCTVTCLEAPWRIGFPLFCFSSLHYYVWLSKHSILYQITNPNLWILARTHPATNPPYMDKMMLNDSQRAWLDELTFSQPGIGRGDRQHNFVFLVGQKVYGSIVKVNRERSLLDAHNATLSEARQA